MVQIFACASALLSTDFVEGFEPEALAAKFIKVEKEYSVKFRKTNTSFNITGHWKDVQDAHRSLLLLRLDDKKASSVGKTEAGPQTADEGRPTSNVHVGDEMQLDQSTEDDLTVDDPVVNEEYFHHIQGNPKRGRHANDRNKTKQVPEPFVYIHYQDQSYSNEDSVNMDKVLDEFEKGRSSNNVTKEDLKKIFDRNIEQMGRPLNKSLPKGAIISKRNEMQGDISAKQAVSMLDKSTNRNVLQSQIISTPSLSAVAEKTDVNGTLPTDQVDHQSLTCIGIQQNIEKVEFLRNITPMPFNAGCVPAAGLSASDIPGHLNSVIANEHFAGTTGMDTEYNRIKVLEDCGIGTERNQSSQGIHSIRVETVATETAQRLKDCHSSFDVPGLDDSSVEINTVNILNDRQEPQAVGKVSESCCTDKQKKGQPDQYKNYRLTANKQTSRSKKTKVLKENGQKTPEPDKLYQSAVNIQQTKTFQRADRTVSQVGDTKKKELEQNNLLDGDHPDSENKPVETSEKPATVYKCGECNYQGNRKKRLTEHMGRVHGLLSVNSRGSIEQKRFVCNLCDKVFVFGKDLNRHKKIVHHENRFYCETCKKMYKSKYVYDKHMETHVEGYVQPMFKCQICEREFTTKFSLGCHIKSEHLGLKKTYSCPICGKTFSQIRSYRQHANVHAGIRPYVCEICQKSFTYDKSLKEHRYMHDDVRRFPCTICNKAFRQRTCLLIHMKVHKGSKDHICSSCGKGFTQKQSLVRHERIHTGSKPYSCRICSKSFSDYAVIRKHVLMSHKKDKADWKEFVICEEKQMSDHYIVGGPGYVKRERSEQMRQDYRATVIPSDIPGGKPLIMDNSTHGTVNPHTSGSNPIGVNNVGVNPLDKNTCTYSSEIYTKDIHGAVDHGEFPMVQSNSDTPGYQVLMYPSVDSNPDHCQQNANAKTDPTTSQTSSSLNYPASYNTLSSLANSTYLVSGSGDHVNVVDENILSAFSSQMLAPLTGVGMVNMEHDPRGLNLNPSVLGTQTSVLNLGQHGVNVSSSLPVTSHSSPEQVELNMPITAATLSAWGFTGYQGYFNAANFNQFQPQE